MDKKNDDPASQPTELGSTVDLDRSSSMPADDPERQIGPYRLIEPLGEGGMGQVWLAEQLEPVKRRVALKLIKPGMDTKQVVARFEAERQALARMDHPAIAKVYEAGETPRGRPYFVMEYVDGVPITEHCDRGKLSADERLELFVRVCEGVQHAHQKAVIHRDLKPSNVLVTEQDGRPVPKIIDFGVAKAIAEDLTDKTLETRLGGMIGTPAYMSPEQAEITGKDIDTRTDVYALGVMLYELLVGVLPFEMRELQAVGFEAMVKKIREEDPPRPSARLSALGGEQMTESAERRATDGARLKRDLEGDLDWVTMKALSKEPARRYASPSEFAADVQRYLKNEPVVARPPSSAYLASKFLRRHRWGVGAAVAAVLVVIAFAVTMTVQAGRIAEERDTAEQVVSFQQEMLSELDPEQMGLRLRRDLEARVAAARENADADQTEVEAALDRLRDVMAGVNMTDLALGVVDENILVPALASVDEAFDGRPLLKTRLQGGIGVTYNQLGLLEQARPLLEETLATRKSLLGPDHPDTVRAMTRLADVYVDLGRYEESEGLRRDAFETGRRVLGDDDATVLAIQSKLGWVVYRRGDHDAAESLLVDVVERMRRVGGPEAPSTLEAQRRLGGVYQAQARHDEAEELIRHVLETRTRVLGEGHWATVKTSVSLARLYRGRGREDEAVSMLEAAVSAQRSRYGTDSVPALSTMHELGASYQSVGRLDDAEEVFRETAEKRKEVLGPDHPRTLETVLRLGTLYYRQGRFEEAEPLLVEVLTRRREVLGPRHQNTVDVTGTLAGLLRSTGRLDEAERLLSGTLRDIEREYDDDHRMSIVVLVNLANILTAQGDYERAESLFERALEGSRSGLGRSHPMTLQTALNYGLLQTRLRRLDRAREVLGETLSTFRAKHPSSKRWIAGNLHALAAVEALAGNREQGLDWLRQSVETGYFSAARYQEDDDLAALHGPGFDAILAGARGQVDR